MSEAENKSSCCCCSPWKLWLSVCQGWNKMFEWIFYKLGYHMALRPWLPCIGVFMLSAGFIWGFALIELESRTEKLFVPQDSRAFSDLDVAAKHFPVHLRMSTFLISKQDGGNVLTSDAMRAGLRVHNEVIRKTNFETSCFQQTRPVTNATEDVCMMSTPAELFNYNSSQMTDVMNRLTSIYNDPSFYASDGDPAANSYGNFFGRDLKIVGNTVQSAKVLNFRYFSVFHLSKAGNEINKAWEKDFLLVLKAVKPSLHQDGYNVYFFTPSSVDESASNSTLADTKYVSISFTVMITLTTVFFTKPWMPSYSHGLLSLSGIGLIGLSLGIALGFCIIVGVPFVSIVGVLPFVVIGIAIDDIFVILDTLDRTDMTLPIPERIATAMSRCGGTITMTTLTDIFAFALSTTSRFPGIEYFCLYGLAALFVSYLFIITSFVSLMSWDLKRIKNNRADYLFCIKRKDKKTKRDETEKEHKTALSMRVMKMFGTVLMKTPVRILVIIFSLGLLAAGIYGTTKINEKFDLRMLGQDGSYYIEYLSKEQELLNKIEPVNVVTTSELDYSNAHVQDELVRIATIMADDPHYEKGFSSWIVAFRQWGNLTGANITGQDFESAFNLFVYNSTYRRYLKDFDLTAPPNSKITAARIILYMKSNLESTEQKSAMTNIRTRLDEQLSFKTYPISYAFIYYEQFAITQQQTLQSLGICCIVITFITALYVVHPGIVAILLFSFVGLLVELFGMMAAWDVNLNSISMVCLVMSIGFAVDYSAHIAHAFATSKEDTPEDRVIDALSKIGSSVFMGGTSTAFGIASLGFASSGVFRIFFKMFLGIVLLGLLNGLIINPVYISIFCRTRLFKEENSFDVTNVDQRKKNPSVENTVDVYGLENRAVSADAEP